jgi:hypothetical protein
MQRSLHNRLTEACFSLNHPSLLHKLLHLPIHVYNNAEYFVPAILNIHRWESKNIGVALLIDE